jgi:hypothetical protein
MRLYSLHDAPARRINRVQPLACQTMIQNVLQTTILWSMANGSSSVRDVDMVDMPRASSRGSITLRTSVSKPIALEHLMEIKVMRCAALAAVFVDVLYCDNLLNEFIEFLKITWYTYLLMI